jgi:probable HAF family extracellular repeat protein
MPTLDPFFWDKGTMIDIGTLGGTFAVPGSLDQAGVALNNRGQVVGTSSLAGDQTWHPFLWDQGVLTDLGTFGGSTGQAVGINDAGEIVGEADFPGDQVHDAFLWKNGAMTDLGNLGLTSFAFAINNRGQVVGHSRTNDGSFHAFLWENGGPMVDLNTLIPPGSGLLLRDALYMNDGGEIAGLGVPPGCENAGEPPDPCGHAYVLIPCDEDGAQGCEDSAQFAPAATQSNVTPVTKPLTPSTQRRPTPRGLAAAWRAHLAQRYHIPGALTRPAD